MRVFRRLGFALWLALALVAGQQAAMLHALAHASDTLAQKDDSRPAPSKCGDCSACAQLSAGAAATPPVLPEAACAESPSSVVARTGSSSLTLPYHSRAPPALS